jgi:hypothetical protein
MHNKELQDLCFSPNVTGMVSLRRTNQLEQGTYGTEEKVIKGFNVRKSEKIGNTE